MFGSCFLRFLGSAAICIAAALVSASPSHADFVGDLELLQPGCESTGHCQLGRDFGFVDASGTGWQADKGLLTDGASIPPWAQSLVGKPFEKAFIRAAVLHDHYCDRHVRPWRQTHRVFYEALLNSDVAKGKAGIMYFAVMVGGPKWVKLTKGKPCPVGMSCINQINVSASVPGSAIALGDAGDLFVSRPDEYGSAGFANIMADSVPELEKAGDILTPEQVEAMAAKAMSDDFYFMNGDEVGSGLSVKVEVE